MSNAVRHRYEKMGCRPSLQYQIQQERYIQNAQTDAQIASNKKDSDCHLRSNWRESQEEASFGRLQKSERRQMAQEIIMARKACIKVRQAALRQLLERETQLYQNELNKIGKAFYISN